jgi:hypothetical protein
MSVDAGLLRSWRLVSQRLGAQRCTTPEEAVEWLGGVQAQDYRWARWSVGLRTAGSTDEDVDRAIRERRIVRTWVFRGTLHFVAARDLAWLTSLLAPTIIRRDARRYGQLELDDEALARSQRVMRRALEAHWPLTRAQIKERFEREGVPAEGQQLPYLLQRAALDGMICQGPPRDSEPTYVLLSEWIEPRKPLDRDEALVVLARRYFASHGPATRQDLARWSGLSAKETRLAIDGASGLVPLEADGVHYWAAGDPPSVDVEDTTHLLPPFDEYLLGYKDRSPVLDPAYARRVNPGGGMLKPTVLLNGHIAAVWGYESEKEGLAVTIQPFGRLEAAERDLIDAAGTQLGRFLSLPVKLTWTTSESGRVV